MDNLNLKVHHVGVCCKDIDQTGSLYSQLGFSISDTFKDEFQKVYVKVFTLVINTVELVAPLNETSPIQKTIAKMGVSTYHICYETENIDETLLLLRKYGYMPISKKTQSIFDGRMVIFLFHKNNCIIELIQK